MKNRTKLMAPFFCGAILATLTVLAAPDHDLHINGHFRGQAQGFSPAPGWTLTADGGNARILPGYKPGKFMLELLAAQDRSQSVVSALHPVFGNAIEIKADVKGRGYATLGFEAFDQSGTRLLSADKQTCRLDGLPELKFKRYFYVNSPAQMIRVRLSAEPGSTAIFRDVEAEMKLLPGAPAPAPAPGTIAAPAPAPAVVAAPAPAPAPAVVAAPAPAPAAAPAPAPVSGPVLVHKQYVPWRSLGPVSHFQVQIPVGSEIEFKLEEHRNCSLYWNVVSYDARICRIKQDHDRDGVFPFRVDSSEFEIKALWRGSTNIVLSCGRKKVIIHFIAL